MSVIRAEHGAAGEVEESGLENGSVFLKQLDNLFGLGPLPKRCGNDGQPGRGEEGENREGQPDGE